MSEHNHQSTLVSWFKAQYPKYSGCILAIPNAQILIKNRSELCKIMAYLKKEGFKKGASDLFIAVPKRDKHGLWLEMKDGGKTLCSVTQEQREHIDLMLEMGYAACWAAGFDAAQAIVRAYMDD